MIRDIPKRYAAAITGVAGGLWWAVDMKISNGATVASLTIEDWWHIAGVALGFGGGAHVAHKAPPPKAEAPAKKPTARHDTQDADGPNTPSAELIDALKWAEGFRARPYVDSVGVLTVGYGQNLEAHPVADEVLDTWHVSGQPEAEAQDWLRGHAAQCIKRARQRWPWLDNETAARRDVIYGMAYNLGVNGLAKWTKTMAAAARGDWPQVVRYIASSKYAKQVKRRARRNMKQLLTGQYQPLDGSFDTELPFITYRGADGTIVARRVSDGGIFSTMRDTVESAKQYVDAVWEKDRIGAPSDQIDWSIVSG